MYHIGRTGSHDRLIVRADRWSFYLSAWFAHYRITVSGGQRYNTSIRIRRLPS